MNETVFKSVFQKLANTKFLSRWIIFSVDLSVSVLVSLVTVLLIGRLTHPVSLYVFIRLALLAVLASMLAFFFCRVYKGVVRHSTLQELWRIGAAVLIKISLILSGILLLGTSYSGNTLVIGAAADLLLTLVMLVFLRVLLINIYNIALLSASKKLKNILIFGTDNQAVGIASTLSHSFLLDYRITGYLEWGASRKAFRIAGLSVYYIRTQEDLIRLVKRNNIDGILFSNVRSAQQEQNRLIRFCEKINLRTLVVPPMEELENGKVQRSIRRIKIEDLLGRDEIKINMKEIAAGLDGKVVMVTGAAGSIGSELCRQLASFGIKQLVLFDSAETPMHNIRLELEEKYPNLTFVPIIGDVRSEARIDYVFRRYHPQVIFHAAAYKHVPLMESNPCEAVRVNVYGTRNVADHAVRYGVERFVMISTDKAVNPTNIMGCSKRLAEIYVQSLSIAIEKGEIDGSTRFITTRFGNVLGSNGSVIPRFREQIKRGGPVTVTDPDIIRYFMTIPEACRLVMEAATMGKGGEIFIFEMGNPVKIADLARRMIELAGFEPEKEIKIEYTGLRPGEKLYEELLSNKENTIETPHRKIRVAKVRKYNYREVVSEIEKLSELSEEVKIPEMVREMKAFVPEFISQHSEFEKFDKKAGAPEAEKDTCKENA